MAKLIEGDISVAFQLVVFTDYDAYTSEEVMDQNGRCLFAAGSTTKFIGSLSFRTFSTRQIAFFGCGAANVGNAATTFCCSVSAISKLNTMTVESL